MSVICLYLGVRVRNWGRVSCEGSNDIWLTNAFSSNLNAIKPTFFTSHVGIFIFDIKFNKHSGDKALSSLWKYKKNCPKGLWCHSCFPSWPWSIKIFFEKLMPQIWGKVNFEKHPLKSMLLGLSISCIACLVS